MGFAIKKHQSYIFVAVTILIFVFAAYLYCYSDDTLNEARVIEHAVDFDVNKVSPSWLLEKLDIPEPYASQASRAVDTPAHFEKILKSYFLNTTPLKGLPSIEPGKVAKNYREGVLKLKPNPAIPFELPFDWNQSDLGRNFLAQLHSLRFLSSLMEEYKKTNDREIFQTVERVFLDWTLKNPHTHPMHRRA